MKMRLWFELQSHSLTRALIALACLQASACPHGKSEPQAMHSHDASTSDAAVSSASGVKDNNRSRKGEAIGSEQNQDESVALADGGMKAGHGESDGGVKDAGARVDGAQLMHAVMPDDMHKDGGSTDSG